MPPKKSKGASKKKVEASPPVPDAQPPLPDEQPPLPEKQPPLPTEQPPLPDEQPPLPTEQPPLPDAQPPLPTEAPPLSDEPVPGAQPITSLGEGDGSDEEEDDDDDDDDEGDADAAKDKGKGKAKDGAHPWQAVWAPANNAYYFWNTETGEVTWTNPLVSEQPPLPEGETPPPLPAGPAPGRPSAMAGGLPEIDPALAHLLPAEQRDGSTSGTGAAMAARTGRLATDYGYAFAALDEYSRQKRFNEHYFDVEGWEKQKAADAQKRKAEAEAGISRERKITKKDMDRFRAKKAEQKHRRQAWLYD